MGYTRRRCGRSRFGQGFDSPHLHLEYTNAPPDASGGAFVCFPVSGSPVEI